MEYYFELNSMKSSHLQFRDFMFMAVYLQFIRIEWQLKYEEVIDKSFMVIFGGSNQFRNAEL